MRQQARRRMLRRGARHFHQRRLLREHQASIGKAERIDRAHTGAEEARNPELALVPVGN